MIIIKPKETTFGQNVVIVAGCTHDKLCKWLKKKYEIDHEHTKFPNGQMFSYTRGGHRLSVVWVEKFDSNPYWIGVAGHEIFHLVVRILATVGVGIKSEYENGDIGDETAAYLFEFYLEEYLKKLYKHLNGGNNKGRNSKGSRNKKRRASKRVSKRA